MNSINLHNYEAFLTDYFDGNLDTAAVAELKAFVLANPQLEIDLSDIDLPSFAKDTFKVDFKSELKKTENYLEDQEIIDYLEHNLPEAKRQVFELKLLNNIELQSKLAAYKKTILHSENSVEFSEKSMLKRTEDELILNNLALAFIENQLKKQDKIQFENELKTDLLLQKEVSLFNKTTLEADPLVVFPDKESLKKETSVIALFSYRTIAAMAAAVLLLFGLVVIFNHSTSKPTTIKEMAETDGIDKLKNADNQSLKAIDAVVKFKQTLPQPTHLIATNTVTLKINKVAKQDTLIRFTHPNTNLVINEKIKPLFNSDSNLVKEKLPENSTNFLLASTNSVQTRSSKQNYLIAEVPDEQEPGTNSLPEKKSFWQRAVKLAKQANKLGLRSIDGEETSEKNYSLSFNAFSVEKR